MKAKPNLPDPVSYDPKQPFTMVQLIEKVKLLYNENQLLRQNYLSNYDQLIEENNELKAKISNLEKELMNSDEILNSFDDLNGRYFELNDEYVKMQEDQNVIYEYFQVNNISDLFDIFDSLKGEVNQMKDNENLLNNKINHLENKISELKKRQNSVDIQFSPHQTSNSIENEIPFAHQNHFIGQIIPTKTIFEMTGNIDIDQSNISIDINESIIHKKEMLNHSFDDLVLNIKTPNFSYDDIKNERNNMVNDDNLNHTYLGAISQKQDIDHICRMNSIIRKLQNDLFQLHHIKNENMSLKLFTSNLINSIDQRSRHIVKMVYQTSYKNFAKIEKIQNSLKMIQAHSSSKHFHNKSSLCSKFTQLRSDFSHIYSAVHHMISSVYTMVRDLKRCFHLLLNSSIEKNQNVEIFNILGKWQSVHQKHVVLDNRKFSIVFAPTQKDNEILRRVRQEIIEISKRKKS
ncbi:hypothetical protein TRFO_08235 [Tritrichomonas foetus]|uniref:Uncharacterized protein n=1 Tax=Tritrichomonas foetus TaxID=1144522 RepID=A0A1J4JLD6_9EUKA|nr:hypothetical protein TRFO_08235 [Tritrichomonas foetus]|eukprot:OHS99910.1 hypothetical protein TRFO_08235 [Tritrichomonas foetus]